LDEFEEVLNKDIDGEIAIIGCGSSFPLTIYPPMVTISKPNF
jgi:hypothetical protein